jgi:hypothetical protein
MSVKIVNQLSKINLTQRKQKEKRRSNITTKKTIYQHEQLPKKEKCFLKIAYKKIVSGYNRKMHQ